MELGFLEVGFTDSLLEILEGWSYKFRVEAYGVIEWICQEQQGPGQAVYLSSPQTKV